MKIKHISLIVFAIFWIFCIETKVYAQVPYTGIQNSSRKGMVSAAMNPAEINNLEKKVEVQFFTVNALIGNNVLSFQQIMDNRSDLLDALLEVENQRVSANVEGSAMLPSFGLHLGKWSIGWLNQVHFRTSFLEINPDLGSYILESSLNRSGAAFSVNNPQNQRANGVLWGETGIIVGREIFVTPKHRITAGLNAKMFFPFNYSNIGIGELTGTLTADEEEVRLTNARGRVNFTYDRNIFDLDNFNVNFGDPTYRSPRGFGLDIGANWQMYLSEKSNINAGLAIRNIGALRFGDNFVNHTFRMNIPEGESFRIDLLEDNFADIETQLLESGFFSWENESTGLSVNLPTVFVTYLEWQVNKRFYISAYSQQMLRRDADNLQIPTLSLFAVTPSFLVNKFEIYSPWGVNDISGLHGGLGLRFGGFFLGSQSILTAVFADTRTADVHFGFSWGFGKKRPTSESLPLP